MPQVSRPPSPLFAREYAGAPATLPATAPSRALPPLPPQRDPHGGVRRLTAMGNGLASQLRSAYAAPAVPPKRFGDNAPPLERPEPAVIHAPPPVPPKRFGDNAPPLELPARAVIDAPPPVPPKRLGDNAPPELSQLRRTQALRRPRMNSAPASTAAADLSDREALRLARSLGLECDGDAAVARMLLTDYQPKQLSEDFRAFVALATGAPPAPQRRAPVAAQPAAPQRAPDAGGDAHDIAGLAFNTLRVPSDGNCLHHALQGRALTMDEVRDSRAFVAQRMRPDDSVDYQVEMRDCLLQSKVYSDHPGFNEGHADQLIKQMTATPFDAYVALQQVPGMHGGLPELQTWSRATRQDVTVLDHASQSAIMIRSGQVVAQHTLAQYGASAHALAPVKTLFFRDQHWEPVHPASLRAGS